MWQLLLVIPTQEAEAGRSLYYHNESLFTVSHRVDIFTNCQGKKSLYKKIERMVKTIHLKLILLCVGMSFTMHYGQLSVGSLFLP